MTLSTDMSDLFSALFGDGRSLIYEDGKLTFIPVEGFPKLQNEGLLTYMRRLADNCLIMCGLWESREYLKNQCVVYNNQLWVTTETTSAEPGNYPWVPVFYSLKGLTGDPGRDGFSPIAEAP